MNIRRDHEPPHAVLDPDRLEREAALAPTPEAAAEAYYTLGEALRDQELQRAVEMWQRALRLVPAHRDALAATRNAYVAMGRLEAARALIDREVAAVPGDAAAHAARYVELGRAALEQSFRHDLARSCAEAALSIDAGCADARALVEALDAVEAGWRERVRQLKSRAVDERDRRAAARMYLETAALHAAFDDAPDAELQVREALRPVFLLWPAMPEALEFLERRHAEADDFAGLAGTWERLVESTTDPEAQVQLLLRLASLYEVRFGDADRATGARVRAVQLDPGCAEAVLALAEGWSTEGRWADLADLLQRHVDASPGRPDLLVRLAEIEIEQLGRRDRARDHLEQALAIDPAHERAHALLEPLLGSLDERIAHCEERLAAATGADERREILEKLAALAEQRDAGEAAGWLAQLAELADGDPAVLARLATALAAAERFGEQVDVLTRVVERGGADAAAALLERGSVLVDELGRAEEGAADLVAALEAGADAALVRLERLALAGVAVESIARALAPRFEAAGEWDRAAALLEARLGACRDPGARFDLLLALAQIREERTGDRRGAFVALGRALVERPDAPGLAERLAAHAAALDAALELGAIYREAWEAAPEEAACALARQVVAAGADDELVEAAWRRIVAADPADDEALAALSARAADAGRWAEADSLLERRLAIAPPERRAELELLGASWLVRQGAHGHAAEALRAALAAGAPERDVLPLLADALEAAGRQDEWIEVVSRQAELARGAGDEAEAARLDQRKAQLLAALQRDADAARHHAEVLARNPGDEGAIAALEALLENEATALVAAEALDAPYERQGAHAKLRRVIEIRIAASSDAAFRLAQLRRLAQLAGRELRDPMLAFETLARAFREAPSDGLLRSELRVAAGQAGALEPLAEVMAAVADRLGTAGNHAQAAAVERELADLYEKRLGDPARAIARWRRLLAFDPRSLEALRALYRLQPAVGAWVEQHDTCLALAGMIRDADERQKLWREAARIAAEELADPAGAAVALRFAAEAQQRRDPAILAQLEALYTELGAWADVAWALEGFGDDPDAKCRLAALRRTRFGDETGATALLREVLAAEPAHAGARALLREPALGGGESAAILDGALARTGEHDARIELREALLDRTEDADERRRLHEETVDINENAIGSKPLAFVAAARAFAEFPAFDALLERLAGETGLWEELVEIYGEAQPPRLRRIAAIRETELGDGAGAIAAWKSVLAAEPDDAEALAALTRLLAAADAGEELVEVLRRRADAAEGAERRDLLMQAADTCSLSLDDPERAVAFCREALAIDPAFAPALETLVLYLREEDDREELVRTLDALAAQQPAGSEARVVYRLRRASLLSSAGSTDEAVADISLVLGERPAEPRAVAALEALLDAGVEGAAERLDAIYREAGDVDRVIALVERRLADAAGADRGPLLAELADLRLAGGDREGAFAATLALFAIDPADAVVRDRLLSLAEAAGAWDALAGAFEDALDRLSEDDALVVWQIQAKIYAERLGRPDAAAAAWERVAAARPADPEPLQQLDSIYRSLGSYRELCNVLRRRAAHESAPERRRDLLLEMASILENRLGDTDGTVAVWREILAIDPADPEAFEQLSRLLGQAGSWDELAGLIEQQAEAAAARGAAGDARELRFRLARVQQLHLGDAARAAELYASILAEQQRHAATLGALEEMSRAGDAGTRALAARLLAPIFAEERDWQRHVQMLDAQAEAAVEPSDRAALHRAAAAVYAGELDAAEMAFLAASRALEVDPDDAQNLALCLERAAAAGDVEEELLSVLGTCAEAARTDEGRAAILRERARFHERSGDTAAARAAWAKVRAIAPDDGEALSALARLFGSAGDVDGQLEALRALLAREERDDRRRDLLFEIASLQEEARRDLAGAFSTLRRLLEVAPDDAEALARLDALCVLQERWIDLADVLAREEQVAAARGETAQRVEFLFRLATLREGRLLDREGALALHRQILELAPDHVGTQARLEALLAEEPDDLDVVAALEKAFRATGDAARLAETLEARAAATFDADARKAVLLDLAEIRSTREGRHDLAFRALARAFREFPGDRAIWQPLWDEAQAAGATDQWLALQDEAVARFDAADDVAALALHVARICERPLGDDAHASAWYERARPAAEALAALERLYRTREAWEPLAGVLADLAEIETDPRERVNLLFRLGRLAEERLAAPDRAIEAYRLLLATDPRHLPALRALEPLHEAAGDQRALYDVLAAQRAATPEGSAWQRLALRLAEIADAGLHDAEAAAAHYREVLARNPRHDGAHRGLEALLQREERWDELAELLRTRLAGTVDPREAAQLNERLGQLQADRLGDTDAAVRSYLAVLERDPRHRRSLEALRAIHAARGDGESLAAVLRRLVPLQDDARGVKAVRLELAEALAGLGRREEAIENGKRALDLEPHDLLQLQRIELLFRDLSAWPEVVRTMELQAPLLEAEDPDAAIDLWRGVARIWEDQLHRREGAAAALERILERRPDEEAFERLRAIYRSVADWRRYAHATERFAGGVATPERRAALLAEVAEVHETRLGQRELAFTRLGAAFELVPGDESIRARLAALAEDGGMQEELALIYESVVDIWETEPVAATLLVELGRLQDEKLDDAESAEASFRRVLAAEPAHPEALEALAALFARRGADRSLVSVLEQQLAAAAELEERRDLLQRIARVYEEQLRQPDEAARSLERALELDPADESTREALAALYRRDGRLRDLAALLGRSRDLAADPAARYLLQRRLAVLLETELGDDEAAISAWALAAELDPAQAEPLDALERLDTHHDRWAELLRVYDRKLSIATSDEERSRIRLKEASIHEEKLGNRQAAIDALEAAREAMPGHRVVLRELERMLREAGAWQRLVSVSEELLGALEADESASAERVDLLVRIGDVRFRELHDAAGAEAAWRGALALDPRSRASLAGLASLHERDGNWEAALEMLRREAALVGPVPEARELHLRIGRILAARLGDDAAAEASYRAALAIDAGYLPALRELRGLHDARGDRQASLAALTQEALHTEDAAEKTRLWNQVGRLQLERGDEDAAIHAFEEARRYTPGDLDAARALSERYFAREDWARAEPALDVVCARLSPQGGPDAVRAAAHAFYRLGAVCERLEKTPKALQAYGRAWELDPTQLAAGEGLARLLVRTGDDAQALRVYQAILIHHRDELSDPEVVELHFAIGEIRRRLGETDAALKSFRTALELDSWHVDSHRAVIALAESAGDLALALDHRQKLGNILEGDEKHALLVETAALAAGRLADPWQAIDAYVTALRLKPDDVGTAEKLLDLYGQTKQGAKAVDLLERLLAHPAVQADPKRRIRCHVRLGEHFRGETATDPGALRTAVEHFNAALDLDWREAAAFQALEALLAEKQEWRQLEANYVRMLQRLPREEATRPARVLLYRTLGELYRNALEDFTAAAEAFKAVTLLAPEDGDAAAAWAELVDRKPGAELEAIAAWRKALPLAADPVAVARSLERLHAKRRSYDAAFVAASVVADLYEQGGADETGILEKLRPFAKTQATGAIGERQLVDALAHDGVRGPVGQIFAILYEHAGALLSADFGAVPVQGRTVRIDRKRDLVDPALYLAGASNRAAASLGGKPLELFKVGGVAGITIANTWPACLVAGEEMFAQQGSRRQLAFVLGRNLAFARPELALARFHREPELEVLLQAAVLVGEPRFKRTADEAKVTAARKKLLKVLPPAAVQALQKIAYGFARDRNRQTVGAYLEAAEHTADRAGALLCGDLAVARHQLALETGAAAALSLEQRRRDLAIVALSDAWTDLRKALGLSVQIPG